MYDSTKDLLYEVVYKDGNVQEGKIVDEVTEKKLAYAANCPVTVTNNGDGSEVEGTVLLPKPSSTDPNTMQYTVMMVINGSLACYEDGIDATRIKYRKVKPDDTKVASCALKDDTSIVQKNEVLVPSSITCDSVANIISTGKRAHESETATSVDTLNVTSKNSKKKRNLGNTKGSSGSMTSYVPHHRAPQIEMKSHYMQNHGAPQLVINVPSWLQHTRSEQQQLYGKY